MIYETGKILAIDDHQLWVETLKQSTCGTCAAQKGCGQSLWAKLGLSSRRQTAIPRSLAGDESIVSSLVVGDTVTLAIEDNAVVKASLIAYLLPLVGLLFAVWVGSLLALTEPAVIGLSLIGLALGFLGVRLHAAIRVYYATYLPKITEKHLPTQIYPPTMP